MFKNLTDLPGDKLDDRITKLVENIDVTHCPRLTAALSELINKYRTRQPFKVQQIYAMLSRKYNAIFLNRGFLVSVSFDREKEQNRHNTVYREINGYRYEFTFDQVPKGRKAIIFNKFILDEDRLTGLKSVIDRTELTDALTKTLNGMTHDDLHSYFGATNSLFLDEEQNYVSQIFKITFILFGGDAEPDDPRTGNIEAFIIGLHAARLKFTKAGKPVYKENIEALSELFSVCAKNRSTALQSSLAPHEYYEVLDDLRYVETMAMRAAWHLTQPGEPEYEMLKEHFTQLRVQYLDQLGDTSTYSVETAAKFVRSFDEIFQDVHLAMETNLNFQSPGPIRFDGKKFTPIELITRMHKDKAFASNLAAYFFAAYQTDSQTLEAISKRQRQALTPAKS